MNANDWKPKGWIENKSFPGKYEGESSGDRTPAEIAAMYPNYTHLKNDRYARLMNDYLNCTTVFLHQFGYWQTLEK